MKTQVIASKNLEKKELQGDKVYKISYQKVTPWRMGVCTYSEANQSSYRIIGDFRQNLQCLESQADGPVEQAKGRPKVLLESVSRSYF